VRPYSTVFEGGRFAAGKEIKKGQKEKGKDRREGKGKGGEGKKPEGKKTPTASPKSNIP